MKLVRPTRKRHSGTLFHDAPPKKIFPLLCPVREVDWCRGWDPSLVVSDSGVAEPDCIFVTPGESEDTTWIVTRHDSARFDLEMLMVTPGRTVGKLEITLRDHGDNGTAADVAYTYTSLGDQGDDFLEGFTEDWYRQFMKDWQAELDHYLSEGTKLPA